MGLVLLTACARAGGAAPEPSASASLPPGDDALVLQIEHVGGFLTPELLAARLPLVSVYTDGRVITQGPVPAIFPGPALPNVQVHRIARADVRALADRALAAGVGETTDLGMPPVADLPSTRFTLVIDDRTYVREVYALSASADRYPGPGGWESGLTPEQEAARARLQELLDEVTAVDPDRVPESYLPDVVVGVVTPWAPLPDLPAPPVKQWPGPPLPGEPLSRDLGVSCVAARNEAAQAVQAEAASATSATPWVSGDGTRWSVAFRPLLPHESGCDDLAG